MGRDRAGPPAGLPGASQAASRPEAARRRHAPPGFGFPGRAYFGEYVHAFDWDGDFLGAFHLDGEAIALAADEEGRELYAVRHLPVPAVARYDLPVLEEELRRAAARP